MPHKASVILFAILIRYNEAQSPCDFAQRVEPGTTYQIKSPNYPNNYNANTQCRWIAMCSSGYRCKLDCPEIMMPQSSSCTQDRILISRSGDEQLNEVDTYCGKGSLVTESIGQKLVIGLVSTDRSHGGRFHCDLTADPTAKTCSCGKQKKRTRVVGGQETAPQEYPSMAALVRLDINQVMCGGTIIDNRHILTAAHCLDDRNPSNFAVVVALHDVTGGATSTTKAYAIERFIIHPKYDKSTRDFDIGLVKVTNDIDFNDDVGPACLPFKFRNRDLTGSTVTVLGWGLLFPGGPPSKTLQKVDLNVISNNRCRSYQPQVTTRQLCTYRRGKDACQSDSGGPVLYTDPSTGLLNLVGIVSYGRSCATEYPGINTRVTTLINWIMSTTRKDYCRA